MKENYKILKNKIENYDNIIIAKHVNPDFDAIGSAFGLKKIIEDNFEDKKVFVIGSKIDFGQYENPELNQELIEKSILITCDTANKERVDCDFMDNVKEIFKIDHHVDGDNFGHNELIDKKAIACCQIITLWADNLNLKISKEAAEHLYKGIITDSNRFLYENTNSDTFLAAQILFAAGINFTEIYNSLYQKSWDLQKWINYCFSKAELVDGIAFIKIEEKEYQGLNFSIEEIKSGLGSICGIKEVKVSILAIEIEKQIKISFRSSVYSVNEVAKKFNGGGHRLAAACKVKDWSCWDEVLKETRELIKNEEK